METNLNLSVLEKYFREERELDNCIEVLRDINSNYAELSLYVELVNSHRNVVKICASDNVITNLDYLKSLVGVFEAMKGGMA
ncbi:MAG: hypothetical protein FWD60_13215 [Candidatus Azobacteroides sp.]|nr:hypothetical protein [Candidatus Azobacteroides sp.]